MRVLVIAQKIDNNDSLLGFFCGWLNGLAKRIDKIYVLTLEKRNTDDLAKNIELCSLGKENGSDRLKRFLKFNKVLINFCLNKEIDIILIHMCPEYAILTWPYAKLKNIPTVMWYAHGSINVCLRLAHHLVNRVITSSKDGFRINSRKLTIVGQGINTEKFKVQSSKFKVNETKKIILSGGRISPIKNYETLIKGADILINQKNIRHLKFQIVGDVPLKSQKRYLDFLKDMVRECKLQDYVHFIGQVSYTQIHNYYQNCDLFVSTSNTGSLDKVVLEAMACGRLVLTCNEAFKDILGIYSKGLMFENGDAAELAEKIISILAKYPQKSYILSQGLRNIVIKNHNLDIFIDKLIKIFKENGRN